MTSLRPGAVVGSSRVMIPHNDMSLSLVRTANDVSARAAGGGETRVGAASGCGLGRVYRRL